MQIISLRIFNLFRITLRILCSRNLHSMIRNVVVNIFFSPLLICNFGIETSSAKKFPFGKQYILTADTNVILWVGLLRSRLTNSIFFII